MILLVAIKVWLNTMVDKAIIVIKRLRLIAKNNIKVWLENPNIKLQGWGNKRYETSLTKWSKYILVVGEK